MGELAGDSAPAFLFRNNRRIQYFNAADKALRQYLKEATCFDRDSHDSNGVASP
jgi:hypothetical protein